MDAKELSAVRERVRSVKRISGDLQAVGDALDFTEGGSALRRVVRPSNVLGTVRKAGIAMAIAPEPITTVAGVAMVAGTLAFKDREPASLKDLADETSKVLRDISGIALDIPSLSL